MGNCSHPGRPVRTHVRAHVYSSIPFVRIARVLLFLNLRRTVAPVCGASVGRTTLWFSPARRVENRISNPLLVSAPCRILSGRVSPSGMEDVGPLREEHRIEMDIPVHQLVSGHFPCSSSPLERKNVGGTPWSCS
ncbi:hypothetical protein T12_12811 [Trichinella patagoniensis]|uniref:Uncharacterized protein n=1 Tax=Trichinella patagoniensis TaxID=990121 RepID=A0A0V0ZGJ6_9BILA|nr:hypothetical protein T12_4401 [Trichinella patagoniensis]KRY11567.1 hypothetical protein T12_12811 [Trichinella patagoniensis]